MDDRDLILDALRPPTAVRPPGPPDSSGEPTTVGPSRQTQGPPTSVGPPPPFERHRTFTDLWLEFEEKLVPLGGQVLPAQALPLLLSRGFFADEDVPLQSVAAGLALRSVWDAEVGICWAEFAIAETGSLVVSAGAGRSRLTSLAPPVNVLLVREDAIVATLEEAFARIPKETTVLITGTSRTADIEGVLVRGVHGPRELYVVRI